MGHSINHYTTKVGTEKQLNTFLTEITENAYDPQETSCYHGHITVHRNKVYKNYDEALDAIKNFDNGLYDDHVVLYYDLSKEGRQKVENWNKKKDEYIKSHSIHNHTSKYIDCSNCGSKLSIEYINGEKCPLCGKDLRTQSIVDKIKWYDEKIKDCKKKYREKYWLAKVEYHC